MHMIRAGLFALLTLVALAVPAAAQIQAGTTFSFDHPDADAIDTEKYQLCVDAASLVDAALDAACQDVAVLRVPSTTTYRFTLPAFVVRGTHTFQVRAVGFGTLGTSGLSNVVNERVVGKPGAPTTLRTEK
jgi:hypothetical protein